MGSTAGRPRVVCAQCGRRHYLRAQYAGCESQAVCARCEKNIGALCDAPPEPQK